MLPKSNIIERRIQEKQSKGKTVVLEVEENESVKKLELEENQICWDGFRKIGRKWFRGVPKRSKEDCFRYCRHEGCDL
jgi:GH15 family glucan-1,4-alpha-glucosidase